MPSERHRGALPILFSVVVIDLVGFGIVMPVLPYLAKADFDASGAVYGAILSSHAAMQFVFAPIWGRLSDRIGRRPVLLMTIAGTSVSLLLLGLADSLEWIFAARLLSGAFAANISVASAYITDVTDDAERTRWMGVLGASFGVGFTLGPAIGGLLGGFGYGVPMLFAAGLAALNGIHAAISLKEPVTHQVARVSETRRQALQRPGVRRFFLINLVFSLGVTQLESMFPYYMNDVFGFDVMQVAFVLVGMAVLMGGVQGGGIKPLVERFGEKRLLVGGLGLLAFAFALVPAMPTWPLLMFPLALSAVGRGVGQPAMMGLVSFEADAGNRGVVMGTFQSAASLARVVGPTAAGLLYDQLQAAPFVLAAVLLAASVALSAGTPEPRQREPAASTAA